MSQTNDVVVDQAKSSWSDLWKKEDYLAIWLGFAIIVTCVVAYFSYGPSQEFAQKIESANQVQSVESSNAPFKTIACIKLRMRKQSLKLLPVLHLENSYHTGHSHQFPGRTILWMHS